jgi:hypothetical protein
LPCLDPGLYSTVKSNAERISTHLAILIKDFSLMVKPLTELTKKSNEFIWSDVCQEAFKKLKQAFISPEIMAYPEDHGDFILDTDACDSSIGGLYYQGLALFLFVRQHAPER